jgi:hypothetical protein
MTIGKARNFNLRTIRFASDPATPSLIFLKLLLASVYSNGMRVCGEPQHTNFTESRNTGQFLIGDSLKRRDFRPVVTRTFAWRIYGGHLVPRPHDLGRVGDIAPFAQFLSSVDQWAFALASTRELCRVVLPGGSLLVVSNRSRVRWDAIPWRCQVGFVRAMPGESETCFRPARHYDRAETLPGSPH